jgi:hypothetical protein
VAATLAAVDIAPRPSVLGTGEDACISETQGPGIDGNAYFDYLIDSDLS